MVLIQDARISTQRVEADGEWSLFCPHECPGLGECWGSEFEALYLLPPRNMPHCTEAT